MRESLAELYRRTQMSSSLETRLPEDVGEGRITRVSTPQGISLSAWEMRYHRDTPVEGAVGDELRLLFCLGEGVEWQNDSGRIRVLHVFCGVSDNYALGNGISCA